MSPWSPYNDRRVVCSAPPSAPASAKDVLCTFGGTVLLDGWQGENGRIAIHSYTPRSSAIHRPLPVVDSCGFHLFQELVGLCEVLSQTFHFVHSKNEKREDDKKVFWSLEQGSVLLKGPDYIKGPNHLLVFLLFSCSALAVERGIQSIDRWHS